MRIQEIFYIFLQTKEVPTIWRKVVVKNDGVAHFAEQSPESRKGLRKHIMEQITSGAKLGTHHYDVESESYVT